jgi:folate-binding protein YgfZ
MTSSFFVSLRNRGLIHIEGADRVAFLQGLVSNNVEKLQDAKILYSCLLTPQGKFLHDFFMHHGNDFILLDCEGGARAQDLFDRLNKYRLRADVKISVEKEHPVYGVFDAKIGLPDPRHFKMGYRTFEKPDLAEEHFEEWDQQRIILGIPDGSRDMDVERSTLLECNIDKFNGLDWDKGCYMGQELTARMHYRNLGKKHLRTISFDGHPPAPFSDLKIKDKIIGNMRSSCGNIGLAVIKDDTMEALKNETSTNSFRLLGL